MSYADKSCLYSTVKNTSGSTRKFGFLPPHGVELAANEELTVFGNVLEAVCNGGDHVSARRNRQALSRALDAGDLAITSTPLPIMKDTVTGASKTIKSTSGTLASDDPCFADVAAAYSETPA